METGIIEIKRIDGSIFRVLYLNRSQKDRIIKSYYNSLIATTEINFITNGIHTIKQFENILKQEYNTPADF